jgi:hypothetical protein
MPMVEAASERPLLIVTRRVNGAPCWGGILDDPNVARDVAAALGDLHDPRVLQAIRSEGIEPPAPAPQADTDAIRSRLDRFLRPAHMELVYRLCDWTDRVQARPAGERVILHGDLHGYNLLVRDGRLRCVLDYDAISFGDHHYDLRYLPGLGSSIGFLIAVVDEYERLTGRAVEPAPLLAWHIRTVLGDARCPETGRCTIGSRRCSYGSPGWQHGGRSPTPEHGQSPNNAQVRRSRPFAEAVSRTKGPSPPVLHPAMPSSVMT